jgi:hypothetical protein
MDGGNLDVEDLLAACAARTQHVEADTGEHGRQPSAEILDLGCVGPAESQPGFLNRIVGFIERAKIR